MIPKILGVIVLLALGYGAYYVFNSYQNFEKAAPTQQVVATVDPATLGDPNIASDTLTGLPDRLAGPLQKARELGATGLSNFLKVNRRLIADPRLAAIELDLAALLMRTDPAEARRVFAAVNRRVKSDSPLYARVKKMEPVYR